MVWTYKPPKGEPTTAREVPVAEQERTKNTIRAEWKQPQPTKHPRNKFDRGPGRHSRQPPPEHLAELWDSYFRLAARGEPRRLDVLDSIVAHVAVFGPLEYRHAEFFRTGIP